MKKYIDLRSDTITKPTPGMRKAMYEAEVGDDVFGDDPTVNSLQERVAEMFGKETALLTPSGTMANQISLAAHTSPGDEVICEAGCHIRNFEGGAPAIISSVMLNVIHGYRGAFTLEEIKPLIRHEDHHFSPSRMIWIENSANRAGGTIFPQDEILKMGKFADARNMVMHLDGARIWNVSAATGQSLAELVAPFDSANVCFSKGLGCPIGSMVIGSKEFIDRAHRFRKRLGGGMRQAGILAAAMHYALDHQLERLTEDNARVRRLAEALNKHTGFNVDIEAAETNIVIFDGAPLGLNGFEVADRLKAEGILSTTFGDWVRFVTHFDLTDEDIDRTIQVLTSKF